MILSYHSKKKQIVSNNKSAVSICDALLAPCPGKITFQINKKNIYKGLAVSDYAVQQTIIKLSEDLKIVAEPGGAVAAAALFNKKINITNKKVVVMISGGNIDYSLFKSIVEKQK